MAQAEDKKEKFERKLAELRLRRSEILSQFKERLKKEKIEQVKKSLKEK